MLIETTGMVTSIHQLDDSLDVSSQSHQLSNSAYYASSLKTNVFSHEAALGSSSIAITSIAMRVVAAEQRRTRRQILDHSLANVQGHPNKGHPDSVAPHLVLVSAHIIHDHPA